MRTEDLISMLSADVEPVDRKRTGRVYGLALGFGIAGALAVALGALGARDDLHRADSLAFLSVKVGFAAGVVAIASMLLVRLARPGGERKTFAGVALVPFGALTLVAAISLLFAPSSHWNTMVVGHSWLQCLASIPLIALVPFATITLAVRMAAPTDLVRAGAFAGLAAGGVGAIGYAVHCTDDSLPFIALWYGGTILLCTLTGALLGPKLLRW